MKTGLLSAVALVAVSAVAAQAGGIAPVIVEQPVVVVPAPVSNDWTGAYVGLAYGTHNLELSFGGQSADAEESGPGLFAGYNFDFGSFVSGAELSWDRVSEGGEDADLVRLKGRLGYDAGRVLPYAMVGIAKLTFDDGTVSASDTGLTYGIGVDFALTQNFLLGLELSKSEFSDFDDVNGLDLDVGTLQVRAAYKF